MFSEDLLPEVESELLALPPQDLAKVRVAAVEHGDGAVVLEKRTPHFSKFFKAGMVGRLFPTHPPGP